MGKKAMVFLAALGVFQAAAHAASAKATAAVETVLDRLHEAAAQADGKKYLASFAPDAVFLGTDPSERWSFPEFKAYAEKQFATGAGWTYYPRGRHVTLSAKGDLAWFDEELDNAKYGRCRGTGVLRRTDGGWKIAQYNLTVPVPNDVLDRVVAMIRSRPPAAP
jgi:ketosteroid isomerase-like protein